MPREILKGDRVVADRWVFSSNDLLSTDSAGPLALPLDQWIEAHKPTHQGIKPTGVILKNTDPLEALLPELDQLQLICLEFLEATDGRGYSQASLLRNRHGYTNELRATGEVLVDQLFLLRRCGFDSFDLKAGQKITCASNYLVPFSVAYQ